MLGRARTLPLQQTLRENSTGCGKSAFLLTVKCPVVVEGFVNDRLV